MFSAVNDMIPLFRPRRGRDDRDAGAGLMRNPNQINNVPRRETDAQDKRRVDGEAGHAQRREANALAPRGTTRNVRHLTRGGNRHVSREGGRDNRSILRVSGEQLGAAYGEPAKQPCHPAQTGTVRETRAPPHPTRKRSKRSNGAPRNGKICAPCMIRGVRAAKAAPSWQDLRAVYSQTAVCRAFRMHGAHILPKPAHFGCMARESCHELAIFPSEAPSEMHGAQNLPRIDTRERIAREYCHRRMPKSASREHFAIVERPKMHRGNILPRQPLQECFSTASCQEGPRLPGLAAKSQWRHVAGRHRPSEASANSTTHADTSKKP